MAMTPTMSQLSRELNERERRDREALQQQRDEDQRIMEENRRLAPPRRHVAPSSRWPRAVSPNERVALEEVQDQLTGAIADLTTVLGDDMATPAAVYRTLNARHYGRIGRVGNELSETERQNVVSAREKCTAARAEVQRLLGEPAPAPAARRR